MKTMLRRSLVGWLVLTTAPIGPMYADDCNGEPCVLVYRGPIALDTQGLPFSPRGTWTKEVAIGDMDGDGWPDVTLVEKQPLKRCGSPFVFDLAICPRPNKDLLLRNLGGDLLVGPDPAGFSFALDPGPGLLHLEPGAYPSDFKTTRGYDIELFDFDNDGNLDALRPDVPGILVVLWGNGDGTFSSQVLLDAASGNDPNLHCPNFLVTDHMVYNDQTGGTYDDIDVADIDGDGDFDFVMGQYAFCGRNLVFRNLLQETGSRGFEEIEVPQFIAKATHTVSLGDVGQDGYFDVLFGHRRLGSRRPELFHAIDANFRWKEQPATFNLPSSNQPVTIAEIVGDLEDDGNPDNLPDLTGNGVPDIFLAQGYDGGAALLFPDVGEQDQPVGVSCLGECSDRGKYDVRFADLDLDGEMEAVFANINVAECVDANASGCNFGNLGDPILFDTALQVFQFQLDDAGAFSGFTDVTSAFSAFVDSPDVVEEQNRGGIAVALSDLEGDGDLDVVLGGVLHVGPFGNADVFGAVHLYENQTLTRLHHRTLDVEVADLHANLDLTLENDVLITRSAHVTLSAGRDVVLRDNVTVTGGGLDALAGSGLVAGDLVTLSEHAVVIFEAGEEVLLQDGFVAAPGAGGSFAARITP